MKTSIFDYKLPKSFIAQKPVSPRDSSKMMVYNLKTKEIDHKRFYEIIDLLGENDVLVLNQSKVIPARIIIKKGAKEKEVFILKNLGNYRYKTIVRPGKSFKESEKFELGDKDYGIVEKVLDDGTRIIKFNTNPEQYGTVPFPPYIKNTKAKFSDYQTVYANKKGSVAAPTAGLHFTQDLIKELIKNGVNIEFVTLHVGRGTFLPVKTEDIKNHKMHSEYYEINEETAERLNKYKKNGKRLIAVGTTSVRVLESSYSRNKGFEPKEEETDIFIYPGYKWKAIDAMITNFHLPKSTLLMLVASFLNSVEVMKELYEIAKKEKYRFYSFGDCMFLT